MWQSLSIHRPDQIKTSPNCIPHQWDVIGKQVVSDQARVGQLGERQILSKLHYLYSVSSLYTLDKIESSYKTHKVVATWRFNLYF